MQYLVKIIAIASALFLLLSCHSDVPDFPDFSKVEKSYCGYEKTVGEKTELVCKSLDEISKEDCEEFARGTVFDNDKCVDVSSSSSSDDGSSSSSDDGSSSSSDDGSSSSNEGSSSSSDGSSSSSNGL